MYEAILAKASFNENCVVDLYIYVKAVIVIWGIRRKILGGQCQCKFVQQLNYTLH